MFEYLMPLLFSRSYEHSLLDEACREAVGLQIEYGRQQGIPWGISESAFAALDVHQIYQYQAFGVPGLGLKRGLDDDLVVAPYASALALMVEPARRRGEPQAARPAGAARRLRLLRLGRLHPPPPCRGGVRRHRLHLHGPPPGHDPAGAGQRPERLGHAEALPRRPAGPGHRAAPLRAHPGSATPRQRTRHAQRHRPGCRRRAPWRSERLHHAGFADAPDAAAGQRRVLGDGDQRRRRLQPLARPRHLALASRHHARLLGQLHLREGPGQRDRLVGDPPAGQASRLALPGQVLAQTGCEFERRDDGDRHRRRRSPSRRRTTRRSARSPWSTTRARSAIWR